MASMITQAAICLLVLFVLHSRGAQLPAPLTSIPEVAHIDCNSQEISVAIDTRSPNGLFNGMIYPKGLSKNSSCMTEFFMQRSPLHYRLPLRSCNTMSTEMVDGGVEYFNTIVVQPHRKLVTNQGRGFHLRCRYSTHAMTVTNGVNVNTMEPTTLLATAPMPGCTMKIFTGDPREQEVAENAKIGDPLTMVIAIDSQDVYGLKVSDCLVRDGLGWGEQRLIDSDGCPVDPEIMGMFEYSAKKTTAMVHFQAHKFPYTSSVYYQCYVRLCLKPDNGCSDVPPDCDNDATRRRRRKRDDDEGSPATIEVYSGLYVDEANDLGRPDQLDLVAREKALDDPNNICISQRNFAIGIAIAGLILMLMVIAAFLILLTRRRTHKDISTSGSSIYSGPYTNTAYSHNS
ncbi:zona pellucida domain-containing protein piopio [Lycorma delicatula]|uniref:zona pellucida domain-containing protein piopio n=1 Tax=Lycorma delicatula TaxID=130591 RepID=UPI003F50F64F